MQRKLATEIAEVTEICSRGVSWPLSARWLILHGSVMPLAAAVERAYPPRPEGLSLKTHATASYGFSSASGFLIAPSTGLLAPSVYFAPISA